MNISDWYNDGQSWQFDPAREWGDLYTTHEQNVWLGFVKDHPNMRNDELAMAALHDALFTPNSMTTPRDLQYAHAHALEYFWDTYDFDYMDLVDWEEYREWYDSQ